MDVNINTNYLGSPMHHSRKNDRRLENITGHWEEKSTMGNWRVGWSQDDRAKLGGYWRVWLELTGSFCLHLLDSRNCVAIHFLESDSRGCRSELHKLGSQCITLG